MESPRCGILCKQLAPFEELFMHADWFPCLCRHSHNYVMSCGGNFVAGLFINEHG